MGPQGDRTVPVEEISERLASGQSLRPDLVVLYERLIAAAPDNRLTRSFGEGGRSGGLVHLLAGAGEPGLLEVALDRGFSHTFLDGAGNTPAHRAYLGNPSGERPRPHEAMAIMDRLERRGLRLDVRNADGFTALDIAAEVRGLAPEIVAMAVRQEVDLDAKASDGKSLMDRVMTTTDSNGRPDGAALDALVRAGASPKGQASEVFAESARSGGQRSITTFLALPGESRDGLSRAQLMRHAKAQMSAPEIARFQGLGGSAEPEKGSAKSRAGSHEQER